jgi:hypothetical protein
VQAVLGEKLTSDPVEIRVSDATREPVAIRIEPRQLTVSQTDKSALAFKVAVRAAGSLDFREIAEAKIESLDPEILAPLDDDPAKFRPVKAGRVQVRATVGNLSDTALVLVTADRFETVVPTLGDVRQNEFNFDLAVTGGRSSADDEPEYRVLAEQNAQDDVPWTRAEVDKDRVHVKLVSPFIALASRQQVYRVFIQVRDRNHPDKIEVYPCWVKFDLSKAR